MEPINITVNGEHKITVGAGALLTYEGACALAGFDAGRILSVTVRNPGAEGKILTPGASIFVKEGAVVNVADTSGA